jgi:predicted ATPase
MRGWALAEQGQEQEGIAQMHQGLRAYQATGAEWSRPTFLALLAEAYGKTSQPEEGLCDLEEALAGVNRDNSRFYESELHRLKGELLLARERQGRKSENTGPRPLAPDPQGEAEVCFHKAVEIAQRQQAKSLELRAAVSLARLWQQQGKRHEAHQLLFEIYGWFTEGFDTKDLQDAKTLLDELAEAR